MRRVLIGRTGRPGMTFPALHAAAAAKPRHHAASKSTMGRPRKPTGKDICTMIDHDLPALRRADRRPPVRPVGFLTGVAAHSPPARTAGLHRITR